MATLFKVQSGVKLPEINRAPKNPRRKFPVEDMKPGEMFFVPGKTSRSVSAYVSRITKHLPGRYTVRHVWAVKLNGMWTLTDVTAGATEGVGVWRTD